jgi:hypothetical protein
MKKRAKKWKKNDVEKGEGFQSQNFWIFFECYFILKTKFKKQITDEQQFP